MLGQHAIPDALAHCLKWQVELERLESVSPEPSEAKRKLAKDLLIVSQFLLTQEQQVERDPVDGALLYRDPLKQWAGTPVRNPRIVESSWGERTLVTDPALEPPLPAWAPSFFPREMSIEARKRYPPRPTKLVQIPPFDSIQHWLRWQALSAAPAQPNRPPGRAAPKTDGRKPTKMPPVDGVDAKEPPPPAPVDAQTLDATLDEAIARTSATRIVTDAVPSHTGTPLVSKVITALSQRTFRDLATAAGTEMRWPWEDDKLIKHTPVILYHSAYTVALDPTGKPLDRKIADYGLCLENPKRTMHRLLPPPGWVLVNVGGYGNTFRFHAGKVISVDCTMGAITEYGHPHPFQQAVQYYLNAGGFVAAVTAEAAVTPAEVTLGRIVSRLPDLAEAAIPHIVEECLTRAKATFENWQDQALQLIREAIRDAVIEAIRNRVIWYVVKKIGKRILPVVNVVSTVVDVATAESERLRYAVRCGWFAVMGTAEDTEIAARVLAKVIADEFEEQAIAAIVKNAAKAGVPLVKRKAPKGAATKGNPKAKPAQAEAKPQPVAERTPPPPAANTAAGPQGRVVEDSHLSGPKIDSAMTAEAKQFLRQKGAEAVQSSSATTPPTAPAPKAASKAAVPTEATATSDTEATDANRKTGEQERATMDRKRRRPDRAREPGTTEIAFKADGTLYRMWITPAARRKFDEIPVGHTVVYTVRDSNGHVIYVGISERLADRTTVDRYYEHLRTKEGEFLGAAKELRIEGHYEGEISAHALEQDMILHHKKTVVNRDIHTWDTYVNGPRNPKRARGSRRRGEPKEFQPDWEQNVLRTNADIRFEFDIDTEPPKPPSPAKPPKWSRS